MNKIEKNLYKESPKVAARSEVRLELFKLLGFLRFYELFSSVK